MTTVIVRLILEGTSIDRRFQRVPSLGETVIHDGARYRVTSVIWDDEPSIELSRMVEV